MFGRKAIYILKENGRKENKRVENKKEEQNINRGCKRLHPPPPKVSHKHHNYIFIYTSLLYIQILDPLT